MSDYTLWLSDATPGRIFDFRRDQRLSLAMRFSLLRLFRPTSYWKALVTTTLGISLGSIAQGDLIVSSSSGVFRFDDSGGLAHTYTSEVSGWQGVAFDPLTGAVYITKADGNGPIEQYAFDGEAPIKSIISMHYAANAPKSTIGLAFGHGLIVANPYFGGLGIAETTAFNPADPTDTVPPLSHRLQSTGATGIVASTTPGRFYVTDFTGSVLRISDLGTGKTPSKEIIVSGLGAGLRGLALSADESHLWVADMLNNQILSIDIKRAEVSEFLGNLQIPIDILRHEESLFVTDSSGVSEYSLDGVLLIQNWIRLPDSRYLTYASEPAN